MNERAARDVLLLRAFESTGFAHWSDDDRAWATRSALQTVGADAPAEVFLAARAQAGLGRVEPLDPLLPRWRARPAWRAGWAGLALAAGLLLGLLVDRIGSAQRINLLAPPVWALLLWNLTVYALLPFTRAGGGAVRRALAGAWRRWLGRRSRYGGHGARGAADPHGAAPSSAAAWSRFTDDWASTSAPLYGARLALLLHLAAAALGLGVIAGMYLRGLVLDYRAGWESTFLDAAQVHALLSLLLAPALALSGQVLPDVATLQALRRPQPGAAAAWWIHLYALQLLLLVVLPRLALALASALRARALGRQLPLALHAPYFQRLLQQQRGGGVTWRLWPHARTPDERGVAALRALLQRIYGEAATLQLEPTVAYGAEDDVVVPADDAARRCVLCDLGATPEPESQGRLLRALGQPLLLLDESAFVQRFGAASPRRAERRQAWAALAESQGVRVVFVDLLAADTAAAEAAWLQLS